MKRYCIIYMDTDGETAEYWLNASSKRTALMLFKKAESMDELDYPCADHNTIKVTECE